jgi:hypothetical protein
VECTCQGSQQDSSGGCGSYRRGADDFCLAKVENYPWWPAKKCTPKDKKLIDSLNSLERTLVSLVGERGGLRVVQTKDLVPFSETPPEDENLSSHPKETRTQLEECMAITRRIIRGKTKKASRQTKKKKKSGASYNDFKERNWQLKPIAHIDLQSTIDCFTSQSLPRNLEQVTMFEEEADNKTRAPIGLSKLLQGISKSRPTSPCESAISAVSLEPHRKVLPRSCMYTISTFEVWHALGLTLSLGRQSFLVFAARTFE